MLAPAASKGLALQVVVSACRAADIWRGRLPWLLAGAPALGSGGADCLSASGSGSLGALVLLKQ